VPGIGKSLSLVLHYDIHDMNRFPRGQDFVAYGRLVKSAKEAAGKRLGTSGKNIGNAHLKWAFSEAAVLCLRQHPAAHKHLARVMVEPLTLFCMMMWLPRCLTWTNPCSARILHTSRPDSTRNLPNRNLQTRYKDLTVEPVLYLRGIRRFKE
jgi:hypothetical protein